MLMPGRHANTGDYRYGFNGMEDDNELKGEGNSYDFGARMYDPRVGRWFAPDPLDFKSPDHSTYSFSFNNPIIFVDPDGEHPIIVITSEQTGWTIARVYGKGTYTSMAVKTYKLIVYDVNDKGERKKLSEFNVTRDGFYDLGIDPKTGNSKLVNRASEPKSEITVPAKPTIDYGETQGAYALDAFEVAPLPKEFDYFTDGSEIPEDVKRENQEEAKSVMIHIGGYYTSKGGKYKVGGTYGCYGIVDPTQVFTTWKEANELAKEANNVINDNSGSTQLSNKNIKTSNKEQNRLVNAVNTAKALAKKRKEKNANKTEVTIKTNPNKKAIIN
jgi:RHS repeat-associated protein